MNQSIPVPPTERDPIDEVAEFAEVVFKVLDLLSRRGADNTSPPTLPEPGIDKPRALIAAERDVFHWETTEKRQTSLCQSPARCEHHRCRRRRRCAKQEETTTKLVAARARLAVERAKWQPPAAPPDPPRGRKKGRTGARP